MNIFKRMKSPTPKYFRRLRNLGIMVTAIGGALVGSPIEIPAVLATVGGYLIVAGSVATAIAQAVVADRQ